MENYLSNSVNSVNAVNAMFAMNATNQPTHYGDVEYRNLNGYDIPYIVGTNGCILSQDNCGFPQKLKVYKGMGGNKDYVRLLRNKKFTSVSVERIVASTFIKGGDLFSVEHINGDVHDNRVCNLVLLKDRLVKSKKTVYQFNRDGGFIRAFTDQYEAAEALGVSVSTVTNYCLGRHNDKDYILSYYDDYEVTKEIQHVEKNAFYELDNYDFVVGTKKKSFCRRTIHCKDILVCADRESKRLKLSEGKAPKAVLPKTFEVEEGIVKKAICEVKGFQSSQKALVDLDMTREKNNVDVKLPNGCKFSIENLGYIFENQWEFLMFAENVIALYFEICQKYDNEKITEVVIGQFSSEK